MINNNKKFIFNWNNRNVSSEVPKCCPHCSVHIQPTAISVGHAQYNGSLLIFLTLKCPSCNKVFFTLHLMERSEIQNTTNNANLISVYPSLKPEKFHDLIEKTSPRFVEIYNQASAAEQLNHYDLAGMGYRLALETLIKDFAINALGKSPEEVNIKLVNAIKEFVGDSDLLKSADVVRILGNDYAHYTKDYDIEFDVLKGYLEIFISQIELKLKVLNPPVARKH